ncbi:MAG: DNA circularization N-terminal domain-containing protein [Candidatus Competibacteraceae bacterium]
MAVRIGKVELPGLQDLHTEESRTLVEQRVPEQQGSVFQDLGREPLTLVLEGLLFGDKVLSDLEELRQAQTKAKPLPFAADIAVGAELTDVIIEDLRIRQVAGYQHRYRFTLRLREHKAPLQPANAALAPVNAGIKADADKWGAGSLAAAGVLQNPDKLGAALAAHPDLVSHLSTNDIVGLMDKVKDPEAGMALLQGARDAGGLGDVLNKLVKDNKGLPEWLDPAKLSRLAQVLAKALTGGLDFLKKLQEVSDAATKLADQVKGFDPLAPLRPILEVLGKEAGK